MTGEERLRRHALDFIHAEQARGEAEDVERATGWLVRCRDLDFDRETFYGVFEEPVSAMQFAAEFQRQLNDDDHGDDKGYLCDVFPIMPREGGPEC